MLSGRLALVTGGARGIGRAVCQVLANDGARVIVADLDRNGCEETMQVPSPKYTLIVLRKVRLSNLLNFCNNNVPRNNVTLLTVI